MNPEIILEILLWILVILQIILLSQMLYTTHKRYKKDKEFWKKQEEISEEFLKQARAHTEILNEGVVACGQKEDSNKE